MSKGIRNTIVVIAIIIVLFIIVFVLYQNFQTEPMDANSTGENVLQDANTGLENMLNEILNEETNQNVVNNTENQTTQENETVQEQVSQTANQNSSETENDEGLTEDDNRMTPREEKAIELVKEDWKQNWGSLDGVSFNVSVQNDGKYGVTVYDTTTTESIQFYIVDVDTEIVTEKKKKVIEELSNHQLCKL